MNLSPLNFMADFEWGLLVPITIFMIPIIAILTRHQQKMAELLHRTPGDQQHLIAALQREVYELRQMVLQHAVALDDLGMGDKQLPAGANTARPTSEYAAVMPSTPPPPPGHPGGY